jgi:hypothetical protein
LQFDSQPKRVDEPNNRFAGMALRLPCMDSDPMRLFRFAKESTSSPITPIRNFLADLVTIAPPAGLGAYAFKKPDGGCHGFVQFIISSGKSATIHRLWTREPGQGNGSIILRSLCGLADRHGIELKLKVAPIGRKPYPLSKDQLRAWYRRHGFEGDGRKLIRRPAALTALPA